ncbi:MAG: hypothetical protein JRJ69_16970 [Deltaproteobacteria bacterium]|nr:hypothetical protein [Deltaproteobacteria bacterium]
MAVSTHRCEVVPIILEPHPNATNLSIVKVFDKYTVCVRTEDFANDNKGIYFPPDSVLPPGFLKDGRVTVRRFRGVMSQGLLMPLSAFPSIPPEAPIGKDFAKVLGVTHYEPPPLVGKPTAGEPPPLTGPTYDIENWHKYASSFQDGEEVEISEKIHGTNFRVTWQEAKDGTPKLFVASRHRWIKPPEDNKKDAYHQALEANPWVKELAQRYPTRIFYGEVFGMVQTLHYGATPDNPYKIVLFDIYDPLDMRFLNLDERNSILGLDLQRRPPVLYFGPYSTPTVQKYIDGKTKIEGADHLREGVVIRPVAERSNLKLDRVILKAVSPQYLEAQKGRNAKS